MRYPVERVDLTWHAIERLAQYTGADPEALGDALEDELRLQLPASWQGVVGIRLTVERTGLKRDLVAQIAHMGDGNWIVVTFIRGPIRIRSGWKVWELLEGH